MLGHCGVGFSAEGLDFKLGVAGLRESSEGAANACSSAQGCVTYTLPESSTDPERRQTTVHISKRHMPMPVLRTLNTAKTWKIYNYSFAAPMPSCPSPALPAAALTTLARIACHQYFPSVLISFYHYAHQKSTLVRSDLP